MGHLAQGSDLGGSLRIPAAFCGVVGFRTSPGLVPVWPATLAWDPWSVEGPMARTVADTALMLGAIAGPDPRAPLSYAVDARTFTRGVRAPRITGARVAWGGSLGITPVDPEVLEICHRATAVFRKLGARVDEAHPDFEGLHTLVQVSRGAGMVARHADKLERWRGVMQDNLVKNIDYGLTLTAADLGRAERLRTELWHRVREFYGRYDLILTPTTAVPPFPLEVGSPPEIGGQRMTHYIEWALLTYAFTVVGLPAISVPCGFTRAGLPVGLQIAGRWRDDASVLRAAAAFEAAEPWAHRRPPEA
jgi:amidase